MNESYELPIVVSIHFAIFAAGATASGAEAPSLIFGGLSSVILAGVLFHSFVLSGLPT